MARDLHDGHIHPPGHFCGSNCPKHRPDRSAATLRDAALAVLYAARANGSVSVALREDLAEALGLPRQSARGRWCGLRPVEPTKKARTLK